MRFLSIDTNKLKKYFNFQPAISLEQGINEYIYNYGYPRKNI
jgi:nucleoside-diphosphate-sugar epimerase